MSKVSSLHRQSKSTYLPFEVNLLFSQYETDTGIPESFKVMVKELQSLALDIKILNHNMEEIDLDASFDDDDEGVVSEDLMQTMEDRDGIIDTLDEDGLDDASMVLEDDYDEDDDFDSEITDEESFDDDDEF